MVQRKEPPSEQLRAYTLLIELLSYQFAFPVRWIETQNDLIQRNNTIQRFIEVGPSNVLANMAKKTAKGQYGEEDLVRCIDRQYLSHADDAQHIYYHYDDEPPVESTNDEPAQPVASSTPAPAPVAVPAVAVQAAPQPAAQQAAAVPDVDLSPIDVVISIVAQKIRKAFDEVPAAKSIRDLSAGKSTLQNELIGQLDAEFRGLPEGSEDLTLEALATHFTNFSGQPGKVMGGHVDRLVAARMPAGFNQAKIREYLSSNWGLGANRQTAVLCFAVTMEPAARLADAGQATQFLDSVVSRYGGKAGVTLQKRAEGAASQTSAVAQVDLASIEALKKDQNEYLHKQFQLLAKHLDLDGVAEPSQVQVQGEEADKLAEWDAEFDEEFLTGMRTIFDPRKARRYDSWWNTAREDLIALLHDIRPVTEDKASQRYQSLVNRWSPELEQMLDQTAQDNNIKEKAEKLIKDVRASGVANGPVFRYAQPAMAPETKVDANGRIQYSEVVAAPHRNVPYAHLRSRAGVDWTYDAQLTDTFLNILSTGVSSGLSFAGRRVLVTGAGVGSIGADIVAGLLAGGARVIVTTSRQPSDVAASFRQLYAKVGAPGSELIVLPFNQASKRDCEDLITHIYDEQSGYGWDLDFIIPFAAISEIGRQIDKIDSKSELAHRAMLVNLLRLLGCIKQQKEKRGFDCRPTGVVLPLSPNHGNFGGDGLYSESKLGLETLFNRFHSEGWSEFLCIIGAVIGWTRGTGLMSANNIVAQGMEDSLDILTFSAPEMAFNILSLLSGDILEVADDKPIYADLSGGLQGVSDLKEKISGIRKKIVSQSRIRQALVAENLHEQKVLLGTKPAEDTVQPPLKRRSNIEPAFPPLSNYSSVTAGLQSLQGMIDLSRTVVVVGYSELGPWGSARTRWEMEHGGRLSLEGYTELAWMMGLIKHFDGDLKGKQYAGWVDSKTKEPVDEADIEEKYGQHILGHAGIRVIEPELSEGYDPAQKEIMHEVVIDEDLPPFEAPQGVAQAFKLRHGDKVALMPIEGSESVKVVVKRGAVFMVPKAMAFNRFVAGQLPSGWDPTRYGIPEDIVSQVDPMTVYVLCCVSEAMYSAGLEDPFELYRHIHVSELANCVGTGAGGLLAMRGVYRDRYLDRPVQSDILQESFLNAMNAWTNMLLMGAAGPIKSPSGTCATSVESMDIACEAIQTLKAKVAIVGGSDDFQEEMSYEFGNMKATANAEDELEKGYLPSEMSRPTASSRSGFVESAGCGIQLVMSAELALQMGLPIYGIVAYSQMAGDKVGRSVPAPGQGVLTAARESIDAVQSPLLDLQYRKARLDEVVSEIKSWRHKESQKLIASATSQEFKDLDAHLQHINNIAASRIRDAQWTWSNNIRHIDPTIAPMRAALATWGLSVDDIQVASFHGTSTKANDKNESNVINQQMTHLSRTVGNPLLVICQKSLTGHPKGAAGAWMFNGCLQALQTGIVPGNRNADNVDVALQQFKHLVYPSQTIHTSGIKAFMLTSFGFGQKGGLVVGVAPRYLFSSITANRFEEYRERVLQRQQKIVPVFQKRMAEGRLFQIKDHSAWTSDQEKDVFLDPLARVSQKLLLFARSSDQWLRDSISKEQGNVSVGVDIESISSVNIEDEIFLERNFTPAEIKYCQGSPDKQASLSGRWAAKEAIFKSLQIPSEGAGAPMRDIEIVSNGAQPPTVLLHNRAKLAADAQKVEEVQVSITHSPESAMAIALARRRL
ncbi:3-oxoacyl-synthase [Aspergillus nomiae NRRL 13137]|uniref:Fatty acid synthase subunit alpha n=1 Tax=Aspergillus nomiae NRRL (strain ATCC 15546 / NRRL 13137 / CBS 260.88 / M93) TaxID=1509407 RepID=A0A0L1JIB0_ASPN3|nr:3-oxoacyl-synthase [Aspergillus nomiae NRRL 13137]KNG91432.1 3-oxoacyl-synthase [Aspergillus nomiae NRRL 13137]